MKPGLRCRHLKPSPTMVAPQSPRRQGNAVICPPHVVEDTPTSEEMHAPTLNLSRNAVPSPWPPVPCQASVATELVLAPIAVGEHGHE